MKIHNFIKIIVCAILSIVLILGNCVNSFANEITPTPTPEHGGGGGVYRGNIYSSNNLNQQVINAWNSLTADERADLVPTLYPMIMNKLGVVSGNPTLDYEIVSQYWTTQLNIYKGAYSSYEDFKSDVPKSTYLLYGNGSSFYNYFYEFLYDHIQLVDNELITDTPTNNILVDLTNEYVDQNSPAYKICNIPSYNYMSSESFTDYGIYSSIKEIIKNNNGYTFFVSPNGTGTGSGKYTLIVSIDISKYNVDFVGTANGGLFQSVRVYHNWGQIGSFPENTEGVTFRCYYHSSGVIGAPASTYSQAYSNAGYSNSWKPSFDNIKNVSTMPTSSSIQTVFTSSPSNEQVYVFPNVNALKAYAGGTNPYQFESYWGSVPSTSISSNDLTNYYQNTYIDSHNTISSNNTTIYYPDTYNPYDNTYDPENKTLDFSGIGNLLSSIGAFLGSIINGIAQGIANIVNSITSIFQNLNGLMNGTVSSFLAAVFDFLPNEFITLLLAGLSLSILFMILSFIRR